MNLTLEMRRRTPPQKRISESKSRFNLAVWGRQTGKTTFGLDKMTYKPLLGRRGGIYWYTLQTYGAAEVAHKRYYDMHSNSGLLVGKPHFSDLYFNIRNDATVFFKSGEVLENLRIETLDGSIIDECRQQQQRLWTRVIRPMLAKRKGWGDFYSTPNGFDWLYDLYEFGKKNPSEWSVFHAPCAEAPWWTPEEIESARSTMSEGEFAQEIMAEFRDLMSGRAYGSYGPWNDRDTSPFTSDGLVHPMIPIYVCLDFNMRPMSWTLVQGSAQQHYAFDMVHIENTVTGTFEAAQNLIEKLIDYDIKKVILIGDATGDSNRTSAAGETDYTILCHELTDAGIEWENRTPESNPHVKDRVNCFNAHLKSAAGTSDFFLHPVNCAPLRRDLQKVVWRKGTGKLDQITDNTLTHASDGVGYYLHEIAPLKLYEDAFGLSIV